MSTTAQRIYRIERVLRERYGVRRSQVLMNFCRMKSGSMTIMFCTFSSGGQYRISQLSTTRPMLNEILQHVRQQLK